MSTRAAPFARAVARRAVLLLLLAAGALLAAPAPATAHKLKVFATVEGAAISGFAFFVGGGRPHGARVVLRDGTGHDLAAAVTDAEGGFSFSPTRAEDLSVVVDAGDGHSAETRIAAAQLAPLGPPPAAGAAGNTPLAGEPPGTAERAPSRACDPTLLARVVDEAVARRLRPLLEAEAEAEDKVRFRDVVGGIGMIVGLFGTAVWASARAKARAASPAAPPEA